MNSKIKFKIPIVFFFITRPSPGLLPVLGPLGSGTDATHQPSPALRLLGYLYERAALQLTRPYNTRLWVAGPLCGTMPQAGFDPPIARCASSTECER